MCSVSWLFQLSCQYLPSDWLVRLLWESLFVIRRLSPQISGRRALNMTFPVYCTVSLFYCMFIMSPALHNIYFILLWHDIVCLWWKCRWTPTNLRRRGITVRYLACVDGELQCSRTRRSLSPPWNASATSGRPSAKRWRTTSAKAASTTVRTLSHLSASVSNVHHTVATPELWRSSDGAGSGLGLGFTV